MPSQGVLEFEVFKSDSQPFFLLTYTQTEKYLPFMTGGGNIRPAESKFFSL
jgi:hypothetical protein